MVAGTLYTFAESFRGYKARIAAAYSGSELKVVEVNASDRSRQHLPSFESNDKQTNLFDANAIAYYLSNDQLRASSSFENAAQVLQWLNYGSTVVESAVLSWVYPALSLVESSPQNVQRAKNDLKQVFTFLNDYLKTRTYLVGERVTLADLSLASDLLLAYQHVADEAFRKPFENLNRWFQTIVNQANFKKVVSEVKLAVKAPEFDAARFDALKKEGSKKKEEKKEKKKEEPKPAAAKPAAKKPEPADDAEEEDPALAEPKQNDPFAEMPKGTFNMDEFKRTYSNNDTLTVALPYFWKHFEKEFYSLWYCEYKYSDELQQVFMSSNLIGGMFQRIEKLRKNAFASMCVFGENNSNTIAGVWFWKGQELAFPLCPDWTTDYESYEWRKLNPDDENDKKLVNNFFLWEGEVNGKKFNTGKIFK